MLAELYQHRRDVIAVLATHLRPLAPGMRVQSPQNILRPSLSHLRCKSSNDFIRVHELPDAITGNENKEVFSDIDLGQIHLRYCDDAIVFQTQIAKSSGHCKSWVICAFHVDAVGGLVITDLSSSSFNSCPFFGLLRFVVLCLKNDLAFCRTNDASAVAKVGGPDFVSFQKHS